VNHDLLDAALMPSAIVIGVVTGGVLIPSVMTPRHAARLLSAFCVIGALALGWVLFLVAAANMVQIHGIAERIPLCGDILVRHRDLPTPLGLGSIALLVASTIATTRTRRVQRRLRAGTGAGAHPVEIVPSDRPTAFSLPGRPGQIVVSTAMLRVLDADEQGALFAHERAHLDYHHHRYVRVTELCAAAFPLLRPIARRVRFAVERWADEVAAIAVGDRQLVALALAKAALVDTTASGALAMSDSGVVERVDALLSPPRRPSRVAICVACVGIAVVCGALSVSAVLAHHWLTALLGLCAP
jgi:Zn-dependent protease with chaperone function